MVQDPPPLQSTRQRGGSGNPSTGIFHSEEQMGTLTRAAAGRARRALSSWGRRCVARGDPAGATAVGGRRGGGCRRVPGGRWRWRGTPTSRSRLRRPSPTASPPARPELRSRRRGFLSRPRGTPAAPEAAASGPSRGRRAEPGPSARAVDRERPPSRGAAPGRPRAPPRLRGPLRFPSPPSLVAGTPASRCSGHRVAGAESCGLRWRQTPPSQGLGRPARPGTPPRPPAPTRRAGQDLSPQERMQVKKRRRRKVLAPLVW
ncbi:uncharacterized protein LOC106506836 isoform X2 [Sus scrofa]|uniref:uncharacterized protein LOC106506836 isoform X2 n=1 Tax=Sus scrofa TaxID=9823 RepID=UPI000A2B7A77|nr:uncharacterized protein LOC106506836 isoform X2 [Sus scrofa]